ncbi:MAG: hypothetical protein EBS53_18885, partial [Bacteroidetes bacterium]|nr:hypothetical protein [Bacteroidota bacterium]
MFGINPFSAAPFGATAAGGLSGVQATGNTGSVSAGVTIALTGVSAEAQVNYAWGTGTWSSYGWGGVSPNLTVSVSYDRAISGVAATGAVDSVSVGVSIALSGVQASGAVGTVIEASLDKGRGVVATVLIESGTLRSGDPILAGAHFGRVKVLQNERGQKIGQVGPAQPVQVLGFASAPTSGERFYVTESESAAREIGTKRQQLMREQGMRTRKHITLDEIGRRLAIGNFKELNLIVKGDVDGSVEALSDSLLQLSTKQI